MDVNDNIEFVEKRLTLDFKVFFVYNFFRYLRRRWWLIALLPILISFSYFRNSKFIIPIFFTVLVLSILAIGFLIYLKSKSTFEQVKFDADVKISKTGIEVKHRNSNKIENHGLDWIYRIRKTEDSYILDVDEAETTSLFMDGKALTASELNFLKKTIADFN